MSFGIPVRNGLSVSLVSSTFLSSGRRLNPALNLDFLTGGPLDPRITFSRTSQATLVDATGKLTYAPNNVILNSIGPAASTGTAVALVANAAPDGTSAIRLSKTDATTPRYCFWPTSFTVQGNTGYVVSAYFKYDGYNTTVSLEYNNTTNFDRAWIATFNVTSSGVTASPPSLCTSGVQSVGNGWFRVWAAFTSGTPSSPTNPNFLTRIEGGSGTSVLVVWGQLEQVTYQTTPGTYNSTSPKNLLGYTQEFDNAAWTKSNATVTANAVVAPDGSLTADLMVPTAVSGNHQVSQGVTTTASPFTYSVYAKAGGYDWLALAITDSGSTARIVYFNINTGVTGTGATGVTTSISATGNGWFRCSATVSAALAGSNTCRIYATNTDGALAFTGDGTSGVYIWGAQLSNSASLDPYVYNPVAAPTSAAYYGPRFDYDPVTLANKGLLIEEQRTNLLTYSQGFDNAAWTKSNATITADTIIAPDGTVTADKLVEAATTSSHSLQQNVTVSSGASYTFSVYAKAAERSQIQIQYFDGTTNKYPVFSLVDGTKVTDNGIGTAWTSTSVGNGWWRFTITATSAGTTAQCNLYPAVNGNNSYTGTAGSGIYIYGAQLEAGAFATSYIPTIASQVTRTADVALMQGANFSNWFNLNEGTFVSQSDQYSITSPNNQWIFAATDGTSNNYVGALTNPSSYRAVVAIGGVTQASMINGAVSANTAFTGAIAYKTNDFAATSNGAAVVTDTSGSVPALSALSIGAIVGSNYLNGHIRRIGYYNTRLPNTALVPLTAPNIIPSLSLDFTTQVFNVG